MRHNIRDSAGRLIGWRENGMTGRINGRDAVGRLVGWYDPARDETRDATGRLIGHGDLLAARMFAFPSR